MDVLEQLQRRQPTIVCPFCRGTAHAEGGLFGLETAMRWYICRCWLPWNGRSEYFDNIIYYAFAIAGDGPIRYSYRPGDPLKAE